MHPLSRITDRFREFWSQLRLGIRVILVLLALTLVALALAKPLRAGLTTFSLARNTRLAEAALLAGDSTEARSRSLAAIQSAPDNVEVIRIIVTSMDALNDPNRVTAAGRLFNHPQATRADKALAFGVMARHTPLVAVGAVWSQLEPGERAEPEMIAAFGRRLLTEGKPGEATLLLQGIDLENPPDILSILLLDLLKSKGGDDAWREIQKRLIRRLEIAQNGPIPDWCLAAWERVPQAMLDSAALAVLPESGPPRVRMLRRRLAQGSRPLAPEDPEIREWLRNTPAADRLPLASLLDHCGQREIALQNLEQGSDLTIESYEWLRGVRMQALEWTAWRDFLKSPAVAGIPPGWVQADLALAHARLLEIDESRACWDKALKSATTGGDKRRLPDLSRRVRETMPERAHEAMLAAIRSRNEALPLFNDLQDLMSYLLKTGRDADLLEVCRIYRDIEPGNPVANTRYAYLALLAGEISPAGALKLIEPVIRYQPASPHPRIVAILAALQRGDRDAAIGWIERDRTDWSKSPPFYQWLVSRAETPDAVIPAPESSTLLPSEAVVIKRLLKP
jgi:tetratricopeptide (TPR) repeat protein